MAWNPEPEVQVARDAAKQLGNVPMIVMVYVTRDSQLGVVSYGENRALCGKAKQLADHLAKSCDTWGES